MKCTNLSIALILSLVAAQANAKIADVLCEDRADLRLKLERQFGAEMTGRGIRGPETVLEIWFAPGSQEWTLVQTYTSGKACIVAMGTDWEPFDLETGES